MTGAYQGASERRGQHSRPLSTHPESGDGIDEEAVDARTPLMSTLRRGATEPAYEPPSRPSGRDSPGWYEGRFRRPSGSTSTSSRRQKRTGSKQRPVSADYDVNNPPSVPSSPHSSPTAAYDDVMIPKNFDLSASPPRRSKHGAGDTLIDIDRGIEFEESDLTSSPKNMRDSGVEHRRRTLALTAQEDVCFPVGGLSDIGEEDTAHARPGPGQAGHRRRRRMVWPDLSVLEEWSLEEKEERSEEIRAKKISEPVLVGGRLRPNSHGWHRMEEDAPYRFTYFNEELPSTIHSQTISELLQPGQIFKDLFVPEPLELSSDEESDEEDEERHSRESGNDPPRLDRKANDGSKSGTRHSSVISGERSDTQEKSDHEVEPTASPRKAKRYGPRPVFWLDVLSPTQPEMRVISKAFGIHPLTAEDIMMQEAREKVELFRHYYFVNYRTFEQDVNSEDYLDPVNMSVVVFREGVISVRSFFYFILINRMIFQPERGGVLTVLVSFHHGSSSGQRPSTNPTTQGLSHSQQRLDLIRYHRRHHRRICSVGTIARRRS